MYIPRPLLSSAYAHLKAHAHSTNPSILLLCALDTDSLCAARILTHLLRRDYIPHKIHPVAGYQELSHVNSTLVRGNEDLRFVICLGLGGLVDLSAMLDLGTVECWVVDGRRPWNLHNAFGPLPEGGGEVVEPKVVGGRYGVGDGVGGIKCFDDGDIEEDMAIEWEAFKALIEMPEVDSDESDSEDDGDDKSGEEDEDGDEGGGVAVVAGGSFPAVNGVNGRKRKSSGGDPGGDDGGESDEERTRVQRRRTEGNEVRLFVRRLLVFSHRRDNAVFPRIITAHLSAHASVTSLSCVCIFPTASALAFATVLALPAATSPTSTATSIGQTPPPEVASLEGQA
jgi:cell division control protein 45